MGEMRILNSSGDALVEWTPEDEEAVRDAENHFNDLIAGGSHVAFEILPSGESQKLDKFDRGAGKITLVPRVAGG